MRVSVDPSMNSTLISIGAEAVIIQKKKMLGETVIQKQRIPKTYRHPSLDLRLRKERTIHEAKLLYQAKKWGIPTPTLLGVTLPDYSIYMEYVQAPRLKHVLLDSRTKKEEKVRLCTEFGKMIGILHQNELVHGDLTTSNVLIRKNKKTKINELVLIDFGLSFYSKKIEDHAVDLVNLKKTFTATHSDFEEGWKAIQESYIQNGGKKETLKQMEEVESRIRYA